LFYNYLQFQRYTVDAKVDIQTNAYSSDTQINLYLPLTMCLDDIQGVFILYTTCDCYVKVKVYKIYDSSVHWDD